jgi:protein-S-isoprenylcysteine O-methyltransferase Ste14
MAHDEIFRRTLIVSCLLVLPVGLYFRLKSQATREPLDRRQEGVFILATLRPVAAAFFAGLVLYMINPSRMAWSSLSLPVWLRYAGIGVWAAAAALLFWTFRTLGTNLTDTVVTRKAHTLVTHGPYRFIRHPFYESALLLIVASALMAANWYLLVTGAAAFTLLLVRMRIEEQKLLDRFGEPYRAYRAATGAFFPRL